jgi:ATP-binding cassette subfamily F protein 3
MLQINQLHKSFGGSALLDKVGFVLGRGERAGLVGRNGSGKTTLLKMITGEEQPDSGSVSFSSGYRVGHLAQHINLTGDTVLGEAVKALPVDEDGCDFTYKAEQVLSGLGFSDEQLAQGPNLLSGGFQVRLSLARALLSEPDLLLLDEPTNYLDILSIRWLGDFLRMWPGELILITHDRDFMDNVCTHTIGIHRGRMLKIEGGTDKYYDLIVMEEEQHEQARANLDRKLRNAERFISRFRAQATRAKAVQSRIKAVNKMGTLEKLAHVRDLEFQFKEKPFIGKWMLEVSGLGFGFNPEGPLLIDDLNFTVKPGDRIAVIGKNGAGKTTLLNLLAAELKALEGDVRLNMKSSLAYFGQTNIDRLSPEMTVVDEIMSAGGVEVSLNGARNIAGSMMFQGDNALKKVRVLSGGERSRVLLGKLLVHPANLLLLDEPTNHLDMQSVDSLLEALEAFSGAVVLVTHSEMILRSFAQRLIVFDGNRATVFEGSYDDFLRRSGWGKIGSVSKGEKKGKSAAKLDKNTDANVNKELKIDKKQTASERKARAAIVQERSGVLNPLAKHIQEMELEIVSLEEQVNRETDELLTASEEGDANSIVRLSKSVHTAGERIEELFAELARTSEEHARLAADFTERLNDLR